MMIQADSSAHHRHPIYWFEDGSVIVKTSNHQVDGQPDIVLFRIHEGLLRRHSRIVLQRESEGSWDIPTITIPLALGVQVQDFTSLLAHLYHDTPLSLEAPFQHVAAVLRVSSSEQLDLPSVHYLARYYLVSMFPSGPSPFVHPNYLEEALSLALRYNVTCVSLRFTFGLDKQANAVCARPSFAHPLDDTQIQKGIYYSLVTTTDFEHSSDAAPDADTAPSKSTALTPTDIERCRKLLNGIIDHFSPVLFEPPVTRHMACTNVLADVWFPLVTQPAISSGGLCKPLVTLELIKQIDWAAEGLCAVCVREKREEWTHEQQDMWEKMDTWLELDIVSE